MEEELKCPKCKSSQTRYRIKTEDRICYSCGYVWKINNGEDLNEYS
jgi:transposase-like protein